MPFFHYSKIHKITCRFFSMEKLYFSLFFFMKLKVARDDFFTLFSTHYSSSFGSVSERMQFFNSLFHDFCDHFHQEQPYDIHSAVVQQFEQLPDSHQYLILLLIKALLQTNLIQDLLVVQVHCGSAILSNRPPIHTK